MSIDILFVADPWQSLDHPRDSTLHLAAYVQTHYGARCFWTEPGKLSFNGSGLEVLVTGQLHGTELHHLTETNAPRSLSSFHSVHWRADPPVTVSTLKLWSLLSSASPGYRRFVNSPQVLLEWNEKFAPFRFPSWCIPALVSDNEQSWEHFFRKHTGQKKIVAKPSSDAASRGVQILPEKWEAALPILRKLRMETGPWLVLQEFDDELFQLGETRIFVVGTEICAALNKKPHPTRPIMSLDVEENERPSLSLCEPTDEQLARAQMIARELAAEGVYLATLDFIGSRLLEINITSPGLIRWLDERLPENKRIAPKYWSGLINR